MSNQEIKTVFGYFILLLSVIGFVLAFTATRYLLAMLLIIGGLLVWMIYLNIARVKIHRQTGAILIIFGVLLSTAIFMAFGIEQDMWGGYRLKPEGATLSLILLLFAVMPGLIFFYLHKPAPTQPLPQGRDVSQEQPPAPEAVSGEPGEIFEYPGWSDEDYGHYDPEAWAAYYEGEEYEEEEEEEEGEEEE